MASFITSIMSSLASCLANPIMDQINYLFSIRANVRNLTKAADELKLTKNEVEEKIRSATEARDDEEPTERVKEWLVKVQTTENEVAKTIEDHTGLTTCLGGFPLNCWLGWKISRHAADRAVEVKELLDDESKMDAVTKTIVPVLRPMLDSIVPLSSAEILLSNVIECLKDETVGVIGIWGMGGVGKTSLLKRMNNHPYIVSAGYSFVIWAVVSQELNVGRLQRDIADRVGLSLGGHDTTTESRAASLHHFLKNKKFLLLLDDLWQAFDLQKLGIPCLGTSDNMAPTTSKVVFTTRSEKVCDQMAAFSTEVGHRKIKVECLKPQEAWRLFFANTGKAVQDIIESDERVRRRAEMVAEKCAGLPLALILIARAMSGNKTWHEWEDAVNSINDFRFQEIVGEEDLFSTLKVSYDRLKNDQMRKCFLYCALWPEDYNIPKDDLIRCWLGMGLLSDFSYINVAISKAHSIIEGLKGAGMLEETVEYFTVYLKLHDVIRGLALWIVSDCGRNSNEKWMVRNRVELNTIPQEEGKWREAEIALLLHCEVKSLSPIPYCPNLVAVMFQRTPLGDNSFFSHQPLDFDGFTQKIPALTYLDLSNSSFRNEVEFNLKALANLVSLQYLDLSGRHIFSLPIELTKLAKLKCLIIRDGSIYIMPSGLISGLKSLEILDLSNTKHSRWDEPGKASIAELGSANAAGGLKGLGICLPPSLLGRLSRNHPHVPLWKLGIVSEFEGAGANEQGPTLRFSKALFSGGVFPRSLQSLSLRGEDWGEILVTGERTDRIDNLEVLKFGYLHKLRSITWEGEALPEVLLQNITSLTFIDCRKLKDVAWIAQLPCLEMLIIHNCGDLEQVVGGAEVRSKVDGAEAEETSRILPSLRFLDLYYLLSLKSFCNPRITFPFLRKVHIWSCPQLNLSFLKETKGEVSIS